ncbi:amino acid-binding protein [Clostridia bacterium]|nr:amino acid-binding protein [Clostridia bacterium]
MTIEQVSVFIENAPGTLASLTRLLAQEGYDLLALALADTAQYGILRCLVKRPDDAVKALAKAGYTARKTEVLAVLVPDRPGGLAYVLETLAANNVSVEYSYSFARSINITSSGESGAAIVLRVEQVERGVNALKKNNVHLIGSAELEKL